VFKIVDRRKAVHSRAILYLKYWFTIGQEQNIMRMKLFCFCFLKQWSLWTLLNMTNGNNTFFAATCWFYSLIQEFKQNQTRVYIFCSTCAISGSTKGRRYCGHICVGEALHWVYCKHSHAAIATPEKERLSLALSLIFIWDRADDVFGPFSATNQPFAFCSRFGAVCVRWKDVFASLPPGFNRRLWYQFLGQGIFIGRGVTCS